MNVKVLQQYLHSLIEPLRAGGASDQVVAGLERTQTALEPFRDRSIAEFAGFLARAQDYERQGQWPQSEPPIKGQVVDEPAVADYAERLKQFLQRAVPQQGPMAAIVPAELKRLSSRLKLTQLKELAQTLGVTDPGKSSAAVMERTFLQLTGRPLKSALLDCHAAQLRTLAGQPELEGLLDEMSRSLTVTDLKKLASAIGVPGKITNKGEAVQKIRALLTGLSGNGQRLSSPATAAAAPVLEPRLTKIVALLNSLKAEADANLASEEEIDTQLQQLAAELSRDEAIQVAKHFGVAWQVDTKGDALDRIRRRILERRRAAESIQY